MSSEIRGRPLVAGAARGSALVLDDGLSFAMAFDPLSGLIRDAHGGAAGIGVGGRVLVMPSGRGSSSASTSLAEAIRLGTAPAALVLGEVDEILVVGAIVARRLYELTCPIVLAGDHERRRIVDGMPLELDVDGTIRLG